MGIRRPELDKELLARLVREAHDHVHPAAPPAVELAELAVGVPVGVGLFVLDPEEHQGDVRAAELEMDLRPVRERPGACGRGRGTAEQQPLQCAVVHLVGHGPGEPGRPRASHVLGGRRVGDIERGGDLAKAQALAEAQSENMTDLSHAGMGPGHGHLPRGSWSTQRERVPCPTIARLRAPARACPAVRKLRNRCTKSAGTAVRKPPEPSGVVSGVGAGRAPGGGGGRAGDRGMPA